MTEQSQIQANFGDRLFRAITEKGNPLCVGFDPTIDSMPWKLLDQHGLSTASKTESPPNPADVAAAFTQFGSQLISIIALIVPAIKINIAFFEPLAANGITAYYNLVRLARQAGLIVIGDIKRGDVGHSSACYSDAHLGTKSSATNDRDKPDAVTVQPYLGWDAIEPFANTAAVSGKGLFILVQTSNPSANSIQGARLVDGITVRERVANMVNEWASQPQMTGTSGYSCIGAVVSPTDIEATKRLRLILPNSFFLVPGFGPQGRIPKEIATCFKPDGTGAIVAASRSIIKAHQDNAYRTRFGDDWRSCIQQACKDLAAMTSSIKPTD